MMKNYSHGFPFSGKNLPEAFPLFYFALSALPTVRIYSETTRRNFRRYPARLVCPVGTSDDNNRSGISLSEFRRVCSGSVLLCREFRRGIKNLQRRKMQHL